MVHQCAKSGASVSWQTFEDSNCAYLAEQVDGQDQCPRCREHAHEYTSPEGKRYQLNDRIDTLLVRPRGLALE